MVVVHGLSVGSPSADKRRDLPTLLAPKDSRQYLFKLDPVPAARAEGGRRRE